MNGVWYFGLYARFAGHFFRCDFGVMEEGERKGDMFLFFRGWFIENRGAGRRGEAMSCRYDDFWFIR
jgi:hypothetical protein